VRWFCATTRRTRVRASQDGGARIQEEWAWDRFAGWHPWRTSHMVSTVKREGAPKARRSLQIIVCPVCFGGSTTAAPACDSRFGQTSGSGHKRKLGTRLAPCWCGPRPIMVAEHALQQLGRSAPRYQVEVWTDHVDAVDDLTCEAQKLHRSVTAPPQSCRP
jgi:hypothetical protein